MVARRRSSEAAIWGYKRWGHFTGLNLQTPINGVGLTHQQMISSIVAQGAVPFLNHPRFNSMPISARQVLDGMHFGLDHLEIFNALTIAQPPPDDVSVWDSVLTTGRIIYGVASDDSHAKCHQGKAWIMVRSASIAADSLIAAIRAGDFYATNGVFVDSVAYSPDRIYVKSSNGTSVRFIGRNGMVLSATTGWEGEYRPIGDELYVRAEVSAPEGRGAWLQPHRVCTATTSVPEPGGSGLPSVRWTLYQNAPNPFNPSTTIRYVLPHTASVSLGVYDTRGRRITTLVDQDQEAGDHEVRWDGSGLSSGVYICRLKAGEFEATKRLSLVR